MSCGMQERDDSHKELACKPVSSHATYALRVLQLQRMALRRASKAGHGERGQSCTGSTMCRAEGPSPAGILGDICGCFWAAWKGQHRPPWAVLSQAAGNTDPGSAVAGMGSFPNSLLASSCSALVAGRAGSSAWQLLRRARASWARLIIAACPRCQDLDVPWSTALARMVQAYHTAPSSMIA